MDGIQVVMATHNGSQWIKRALDSVEDVLNGQKWVLGVAIDGPDKETVKILREYENRNCGRITAQKVLFHEFPKADGVGSAKNAALTLTREFRHTHPWIFFMDDDDEMLPARVDFLLANAKRKGCKIAVGDWEIFNKEGISYHRCNAAVNAHISVCGFTPCATIVHSSVIPEDCKFFSGDTYNEDAKQWSRMAAAGFDWQVFPGPLVHRQHESRDFSVSRPLHRKAKERMLTEFTRWVGNKRREPQSVCCFVTSRYERDFLLFHFALRQYYSGHLIVLCDAETAALVKNTATNATIVVSDIKKDIFTNRGIWLTKAKCMEKALEVFDDTLYLDCDFLLLEPIYFPSTNWDFLFTPHYGIQNENYGQYNGGIIACANRKALREWVKHILDSRVIWPTFADQWEMSVLARDYKVLALPRGYNVAPWQRWPNKIDSGYGLYSDGDLIRGFHSHFFGHQWGGPRWNKVMDTFNRMLLDALRQSLNDRHQKIVKYHDDLQAV